MQSPVRLLSGEKKAPASASTLRGRDRPSEGRLPKPISNTWFVYLIRADGTTLYKIGRATDVHKRLYGLQCGSPTKLQLIWHVEAGIALEAHLHRTFRDYRVNREWFDFGRL